MYFIPEIPSTLKCGERLMPSLSKHSQGTASGLSHFYSALPDFADLLGK